MVTEIILYVKDQGLSSAFYRKLLRMEPMLDVPGMTEFELSAGCKLGLMPNHGIAKILGKEMPHPSEGQGIPRCELYLKVENAREAFDHAAAEGARVVSPVQERDWGDLAGYLADPDGHIIAFAESLEEGYTS